MANPTPRPALRKAPDAHINPAHPHRNANEIDLRNQPARLSRAHEVEVADLRVIPHSDEPQPLSSPDRETPTTEVRTSDPAPQRKKAHSKKDRKRDKKQKETRTKVSKKQKKDKLKRTKARSQPKGKRVSGKLTLSADARRKLREADKARGANLDSHVDSVVAAVKTRKA